MCLAYFLIKPKINIYLNIAFLINQSVKNVIRVICVSVYAHIITFIKYLTKYVKFKQGILDRISGRMKKNNLLVPRCHKS